MNRTHYLRYKGETIVDVESSDDDVSCVVDIKQYTRLLMFRTISVTVWDLGDDFHRIQEMRGEYHETVRLGDDETGTEFARRYLKSFAERYRLQYGED